MEKPEYSGVQKKKAFHHKAPGFRNDVHLGDAQLSLIPSGNRSIIPFSGVSRLSCCSQLLFPHALKIIAANKTRGTMSVFFR